MSENPFSIPLDQVTSIDLSKAKLIKPDDEASEKWAEIFRHNLEKIKGQSTALPDNLNPGGLARFYSSSFVQFAG